VAGGESVKEKIVKRPVSRLERKSTSELARKMLRQQVHSERLLIGRLL
jgi:hypothetical protein